MGATHGGKGPWNRRAAGILVTVWIGILLALFRPEIRGMDPVAYYAWLRAAVIQGDLDASATFAHYGVLPARGISPTGYRLNEWPVGPAVLWSPFFLAAHGLAHLARGLGAPVALDGFSAPYRVLTGLGSAVYAGIGLWLAFRLAEAVAPPPLALWAALSVGLASPLIFYMSAHPFMAHAVDFFVNALFLRTWLGTGRWDGWARFRLGAIGGLAACVRYQNATWLVWAALEDLRHTWHRPPEGLRRLLGLGFGGLLGFLPQMVAWRVVFGSWLVLNPYARVGAGSFDWRSPHFLDVLFSTDRGLFLWAPISAFALWGLVRHLAPRRPGWAAWIGAQILAQVALVGAWSAWSGAAAFGPRLLTGLFPAFGVGLAALYAAWERRWGKGPALWLGAGAIFWNLVLLARYGLQDVPRMGPVPLDRLWLGQFVFLGRLGGELGRLLQALVRTLP